MYTTEPLDTKYPRSRVPSKVSTMSAKVRSMEAMLPSLSESERLLACCMIAREKIEVGDYDAACAALRPWWSIGNWPLQDSLTSDAAAELLFTAGWLSGLVSSTKQTAAGQKPAEAL